MHLQGRQEITNVLITSAQLGWVGTYMYIDIYL
jgi:hypothetical protein